MAKYATTSAKNIMKRSLHAILSPHPTDSEVAALWNYFVSACAYCGIQLDKAARNGHMDHVVPSSRGGTNSIFNHVLSCGRCNGDAKREATWETYLAQAVPDLTVRSERAAKITQWLARATPATPPFADPRVDAVINRALEAFDQAVTELRALRDHGA
ncbi:MAG: HNH endonuclease signature motif containing protein [Isosphaeraceae bacterium]|jgi:hypothetical protein